MAEEQTEITQKQEEAEVKQEASYTEEEQKAMANGWTPKDQWEGPEDEWVSAKQFNKNGELFGRINSYKHKISGLEKTVTALVKHNEKVYETAFKDALDKLKAERRVALREGDAELVEEIEERIEKVQEQQEQQQQEFKQDVAAPQQQIHPDFEPWIERNSWYANNDELRGFADGAAKRFVREAQEHGQQVPFPELLRKVENYIKETFPEKFGSAPKRQGGGSERGDSGARGRTKASSRDDLTSIENSLSEDEKQIMNSLVNTGVLTREKYLTDMKKVLNRKGRG